MTALMRFVAILFVAIAAFLIYAVVHAATSAGGARWGVAAGYLVGSVVLLFLASRLWRGRRKAAPGVA